MNKKELISAVAEKSELGVSGVEKIIDNFMNVVSDEVCNGGQVNAPSQSVSVRNVLRGT